MSARELTNVDERRSAARLVAPGGFLYPEAYERVIADEVLPEIMPWVWLTEYRDQLEEWSIIVRRQFPKRTLVPFAKHDETDDVFCFDGAITSGFPPVQIIHTFTTPGWEFRGEWASFEDWWAEMEAQHADWLLEREDPNDDSE